MKPTYKSGGVTLYHGDCREVMASLPAESIERCCTDPPYGLNFMGQSWDSQGVEIPGGVAVSSTGVDFKAGATGRAHSHGLAGHNPTAWQAWCQQWATAVLRILKPGGHLLSFGGTRTSHRLVCAIEDAGFEIRDSVVWLYGSGFPKSLDIGKAIDKAAGVEREVVGSRESYRPESGAVRDYENFQDRSDGKLTAPATEAAKQWDGWGTSLKPSHEPICLAMKPLDGTFAANAQQHGVAGLSIDAGRIGTSRDSERQYDTESASGQTGEDSQPGYGDWQHGKRSDGWLSKGRWPANTILSHHPDCQQVGTKRVKGRANTIDQRQPGVLKFGGDGARPFHESPEKEQHSSGYADANGLETVEAWECVEDCPVRMLDEQSGVSTDRPARGALDGTGSGSGDKKASNCYGDGRLYLATTGYETTGGASRFFYTAKASGVDRGNLKAEAAGPLFPDDTLDEFRNTHPTVKPIAIMEYLLRLTSTPTGGTVIDPFAGSGTTGVAAYNLGVPCILIEQSEEYCDIIIRRLEAAMQKEPLFA